MRNRSVVGALLLSLVIIGVATAQDIPLTNWPAPSSYTPGSRITGMANITQGMPFVAVSPCRVYDSRPTILAANGIRVVPMDGGTCGLPVAEAYSVQITAFGSAASTAYYFLTAYPTGATRPTVSTMNFLGGSQTTTAAVVPSGTGSDITIYSNVATHFVVDVNGYYASELVSTRLYVGADVAGAAAILGFNNSATNGSHAIGGFAGGAARVYGVEGQIGASAAADASGVHGIANGASDTYGVLGQSGGADTPTTTIGFNVPAGVAGIGRRGMVGIGAYGYSGVAGAVLASTNASLAVDGYVGYWSGANAYGLYTNFNAAVGGTLSKGAGSFKIDHPLDPENKYLYHSFVESPDMMNIYNGNIELDESGQAVVMLPEWFDALNREFRYQLTAIGRSAPGLYIAQEIANNLFVIGGGQPGTKVSWMVTGVRKDRFAERNRIPVEEVKPERERGTYQHPDAFDQPETRGVEASRDPEAYQRAVQRELAKSRQP